MASPGWSLWPYFVILATLVALATFAKARKAHAILSDLRSTRNYTDLTATPPE
jgi:hypothetical protein